MRRRGRSGTVETMRSDSDEKVFKPGEKVPTSGIYECDCDGRHPMDSTDVAGHTFPPPPQGCSGTGWKLKTATPHKDS